ncbi:hypothetical protein PRZ48_011923 [Zasmidium cellare]|uniref:DUF7730 domain-containing protein n=1 Tax=Zasmidium cellare TaxID=395010 RepID=A0ABR0E7R6_ZASCE|nr:hypothetical protein PRZ48_011923 [Zasmidium cellare]
MQNVKTNMAGGSRNTQTCTFLTKLPAEIRNQIYEYILTSHNIHVDCRFLSNAVVHPSERLNVYTLKTDSAAHAQTLLPSGENSSVAHYEDRHAACLRPSRTEGRRNVPIALLKTCRQVYDEAVGYLYADNTFSFKTPEDMDLFLSIALSPLQRTWIRSLYLHCETTRYRDPFSCLVGGSLKECGDVRYFGLNVADYYKGWGVPCLPGVRRERLERVEVLVGPKPRHAKGGAGDAWRNRRYAEEFEGLLREGDGRC